MEGISGRRRDGIDCRKRRDSRLGVRTRGILMSSRKVAIWSSRPDRGVRLIAFSTSDGTQTDTPTFQALPDWYTDHFAVT